METQHASYSFRQGEGGDAEELARLDGVCFESGAYPASLIARFIRLGLPTVVAEDIDTGTIAGFAMLMPEGETSGLLVTLDVAPEHRRRGLGTLLVGLCAQTIAGARGSEGRLFLTVAAANRGAREFYRALGFVESGHIPEYYRWDDAVVMVHEDTAALARWSPAQGGP